MCHNQPKPTNDIACFLTDPNVLISDIYYSSETLPQPLVDYLNSAKRCVNPQCDCVYFDTRVQDVEFVDFCGLYRVPLHHVSYNNLLSLELKLVH